MFLYAKPRTHIEDLWLRAGLAADNATGTLAPRLKDLLRGPRLRRSLHRRLPRDRARRRGFVEAPLALTPAGGEEGCMVWQAAPIALPGVRA